MTAPPQEEGHSEGRYANHNSTLGLLSHVHIFKLLVRQVTMLT